MGPWEPILGMQVGELRFHPDGSIGLSTDILPVEVAIEPTTRGSVTVRKNSGASADVHVSDRNGESMILRFEDGHWWKRGSLTSAQVTPFPTVHSKGVEFAPTAHRARESDTEEVSSKGPSTVVLFATGVMILFALYLVREPLRLFLVGEVEQNRTERVKAEEAAGLNAIRSRFNEVSDRISLRLKEVQDQAGLLNTRFREVIGMELARAVEHPSERPREVDTMILRSLAFSEAWTAVLNARLPNDLSKTTTDTVRQFQQGVDDGKFSESDEKQLTDLEAALTSRKKAVGDAIDHLAAMDQSLRAQRFEENRRSQERRQP